MLRKFFLLDATLKCIKLQEMKEEDKVGLGSSGDRQTGYKQVKKPVPSAFPN